MGDRNTPVENIIEEVKNLSKKFQQAVESFYDSETIKKRFIISRNREGNITSFPLLTVSSVVLEMPVCRQRVISAEVISRVIAKAKKTAKSSTDKMSFVRIDNNEQS